MQINIDRHNNRTIRLTKSDVRTLRRAEHLVSNLEALGVRVPEPKTLGSGLDDLLAMPCCQLPQKKAQDAIEQEEQADAD